MRKKQGDINHDYELKKWYHFFDCKYDETCTETCKDCYCLHCGFHCFEWNPATHNTRYGHFIIVAKVWNNPKTPQQWSLYLDKAQNPRFVKRLKYVERVEFNWNAG